MKIPSLDYSPLFTATNAKFGVKQAEVSAQQSQLIPESFKLQQQQLDLNKANLIAGTVLDAAKLGLNVAQTFSDIKDQADLEKAKTNLLTTGSQYNEMAMEAILNNTTSVSFEDGKADIQLSPELKEYQASKLAEIDASKKSKVVKDYEKQQLQNIFASSDSNVLKNAAEKYLADTNASFEMNAEISVANDIKAGTGYANGEALINSRSDLSTAQKQVALYNYQKQVDYGRADAMATTLAKSEGIGKALEYAQSIEGMTQTQVQTIVSNASKASQTATIAAQTNAQNAMSTGLEAGQVPSALYQQIEQATKSMPIDRRQAAMDAARASHIEWANNLTTENWESDSKLSYDNLKAQRESIASGERSYIYEGIASTKAQVLSTYDKTLSDMSVAGTKAYSQEVTDNINSIVAGAKLGKITGIEAITAISGYTKDNPTATIKAIDDIVSDAIHANLKPYTNDFINTTLPNIMLDKYKKSKISDLTTEQQQSILDAQMFAAGQFVDLALQSEGVSPAIFRESMNNIIRLYNSKEMDVISTATVMETTAGTFDSAMKQLDTFGTVDPVYIDYKGNQTWANPAMEATFDQASLAISMELGKRGIDVTAYMPMPIFDNAGNPVDAIAKPVFQAKDGYYTFEGKNLMTSSDLVNWQYAPKELQTPDKKPVPIGQDPITQQPLAPEVAQTFGTGGFGPTPQQMKVVQPKTAPPEANQFTVDEVATRPMDTSRTLTEQTSQSYMQDSVKRNLASEVKSIMASGIDLTSRSEIASEILQSELPVENMQEANVVANAIIIENAKTFNAPKPTVTDDGAGQRIPSPRERKLGATTPGTVQGTRSQIAESAKQAEAEIAQAVEDIGQKRVDELVQMIVEEQTPFEQQKLNWKPIDIEALKKSDQTFVNVVQSVKRPNVGRKD